MLSSSASSVAFRRFFFFPNSSSIIVSFHVLPLGLDSISLSIVSFCALVKLLFFRKLSILLFLKASKCFPPDIYSVPALSQSSFTLLGSISLTLSIKSLREVSLIFKAPFCIPRAIIFPPDFCSTQLFAYPILVKNFSISSLCSLVRLEKFLLNILAESSSSVPWLLSLFNNFAKSI